MTYLLTIPGYKPFYVQANDSSAPAIDVEQTWGLIVQHNPYPVFPAPKERYSIDWKDEDGIDEYGKRQFFGNLDFEIEFWLADKDSSDTDSRDALRKRFNNFRSFLASGPFRIYDDYTKIGFSSIRMESFAESRYVNRIGRTDYFFRVNFRCYAPMVRYKYNSQSGDIEPVSYTISATPYLPTVVWYSPFYLATTLNNTAIDSRDWGLIAKSDPHPIMPDAKSEYYEGEPWSDNTQAPSFPLFFKSATFDVDFYIKAYDVTIEGTDYTGAELILTRILSFRNFITDNRLLVLDSFTSVGYADVQYDSAQVTQFVSRDDWAMAIFTVHFRANDPIPSVVYDNGTLVKETIGGLNDSQSIPLYSLDGFRLTAQI